MLKFYYNPISPNARRVWITLLEKEIPFESIILKLDGDQLQPEFTEINPFHHIPVLVDHDYRLVESLAIMDYLEAKYPTPPLLPQAPQDLATVRMVQMLTANELFPQLVNLIYESEASPKIIQAKQKINQVLQFFTKLLGNSPYFGSTQLTLGDIVAGTAILSLPRLGVNIDDYPNLNQWSERLMARPVWQKTKLSDEDFAAFKRRVKVLVKLRRREMLQGETTGSRD
jgi:glutathione S-transferase